MRIEPFTIAAADPFPGFETGFAGSGPHLVIVSGREQDALAEQGRQGRKASLVGVGQSLLPDGILEDGLNHQGIDERSAATNVNRTGGWFAAKSDGCEAIARARQEASGGAFMTGSLPASSGSRDRRSAGVVNRSISTRCGR